MVLVAREKLQDARGRGDRVRAVHGLDAGELGASDQADGKGLVAHDVAIGARLKRRLGDLVLALEELADVPGVVPGLERRLVGSDEVILALELLFQPLERRLEGAAVHPVHQAQGVEVLAALLVLVGERRVGERLGDAGVDADLDDAEAVQGPVLKGVRVALRLLQVRRLEGVGVDDDDPALLQRVDVDHQRRRVHGNEHVGLVARRVDVRGAELQLEARDPRPRPDWRADLGGEVGEGREVVPEQRAGARELVPRHLHSVAGVAGEAEDNAVELLEGELTCGGVLGGRRSHRWAWAWAPENRRRG